MAAELGTSQLSSLLESVPGLASVLRSPVADAIVNTIRAGAGLGEFSVRDARELVQYATRRGLIPSAEGVTLMEEVETAAPKRRARAKAAKARGAGKKPATTRVTVKRKAAKSKGKTARKVIKKKAGKAAKKPTRKATKTIRKARKKAKGRRK